MLPLGIGAYTATTAAGIGKTALWHNVLNNVSGLRPNDLPRCDLNTFIGRVAGLEVQPLPAQFAHWECRNNRLAWLALNQDGFLAAAQTLVARHGAARVALVLGTSTASMASTEEAYCHFDEQAGFPAGYRNPRVHAPNSLTGFVAEVLGITGPCFTVATACSSSARVFGSAERLLRTKVVDAAIVGGVDSLCLSVMYGFHALELMSSARCRPFDQARNGLNIGEAGGFAILEPGASALQLAGYGESSDAHHMSSPHPQGLGAQQAMQAALARAGVTAEQIDYINLHGTATRMNDAIEAHAIRSVFSNPVACSSTKGWTGHTLGAAGIVEAVISLLALENQCAPGNLHCEQPEAQASEYILTAHRQHTLDNRPFDRVLSNSFGFGGNNCALLLARTAGSL